MLIREVAEWSKAHAWKVCIRHKRIEGSNPFLSATGFQIVKQIFISLSLLTKQNLSLKEMKRVIFFTSSTSNDGFKRSYCKCTRN